jgi:hypothetical protein
MLNTVPCGSNREVWLQIRYVGEATKVSALRRNTSINLRRCPRCITFPRDQMKSVENENDYQYRTYTSSRHEIQGFPRS